MTKKQKRLVQNSRTAFTPSPGAGFQFQYKHETNRKAEARLDLIVRVDRAVTQRNRAELLKLKRECKGLPLMNKIMKALEE